LNQGVMLAVARSRTASPWGKRRRLGVKSAEADAARRENASAQGKEQRIASAWEKEALHARGKGGAARVYLPPRLHIRAREGKGGVREGKGGEMEREERGGAPEIRRRLRPRAATPAPSTSATSASSTTVIPAPSATVGMSSRLDVSFLWSLLWVHKSILVFTVVSTMATSSSITSDYDPKTDPARTGNVEDPGWKYAYWPNLQSKDVVACSRVVSHFMEA
jgi:hypothetical protein